MGGCSRFSWEHPLVVCLDIIPAKAVIQSLDGHGVEHSMKNMFHLPEVRWLTLGLVRRPSAKFDNKIAGRFWLDDVSIERVGP